MVSSRWLSSMGDAQRHQRLALEIGQRILDDAQRRSAGGADGGGVGGAEQHAHFAHQRAGGRDGGDDHAVALDAEAARFEHIEGAAGIALAEHDVAGARN